MDWAARVFIGSRVNILSCLAAKGCLWDEGYRDTKERPVISLGFQGHYIPRVARPRCPCRPSFKVGRNRSQSGLAFGAGAGHDHFSERRDHY